MCKYTKEREDYPNISFDHFARIQTIWREKKRGAAEIKKTKLESVEKLTFKAMGGIDHGEWLNDDAINIYIELMDKNLTKNSQCKLLNSYFATTTMGKTENMILRYLKKKGIDKNCSLIMPVNDRRHWFFAKFEGNTLTVYDSIRKRSDEYFEYSIFKNALKFGKNLYGVDLTIEVSPTYPQQNNGYDCGVFMLLGIRDSLRGREWSFRQGDMRFKRTQLACEIYN
jgi:sentrin-specific protease 1